jgi:hypothetical protein
VVAVVVIGGGILFAVLLEQVILAQSAFELSRIREDLAAAESHHEELLMISAKLDNAARIERYARRSLGMVDPLPGSTQYVVADIRTRSSVTAMTVAGGKTAKLRRAGVESAGQASATGANYGDSP